MAEKKMLPAGKIAKELGVSDAKSSLIAGR